MLIAQPVRENPKFVRSFVFIIGWVCTGINKDFGALRGFF
jgi:hypothetical protein